MNSACTGLFGPRSPHLPSAKDVEDIKNLDVLNEAWQDLARKLLKEAMPMRIEAPALGIGKLAAILQGGPQWSSLGTGSADLLLTVFGFSKLTTCARADPDGFSLPPPLGASPQVCKWLLEIRDLSKLSAELKRLKTLKAQLLCSETIGAGTPALVLFCLLHALCMVP